EERRPDLLPDAPAFGKLEGFRRVRANANAAKQGSRNDGIERPRVEKQVDLDAAPPRGGIAHPDLLAREPHPVSLLHGPRWHGDEHGTIPRRGTSRSSITSAEGGSAALVAPCHVRRFARDASCIPGARPRRVLRAGAHDRNPAGNRRADRVRPLPGRRLRGAVRTLASAPAAPAPDAR